MQIIISDFSFQALEPESCSPVGFSSSPFDGGSSDLVGPAVSWVDNLTCRGPFCASGRKRDECLRF